MRAIFDRKDFDTHINLSIEGVNVYPINHDGYALNPFNGEVGPIMFSSMEIKYSEYDFWYEFRKNRGDLRVTDENMN